MGGAAAVGLVGAACGASNDEDIAPSEHDVHAAGRAPGGATPDVGVAIEKIDACQSADGTRATFFVQPIHTRMEMRPLGLAASALSVEGSGARGPMRKPDPDAPPKKPRPPFAQKRVPRHPLPAQLPEPGTTAGQDPTTLLRNVTRHAVLAAARGTAFGAGDQAACVAPVAADATGLVRVVVERPTPGASEAAPSADPLAIAHVYTDVCGLEPILAESGWYEGWLVHTLVVPPVAPAGADGRAAPGTITKEDADALAAMGSGHNRPGAVFTLDGNEVHEAEEAVPSAEVEPDGAGDGAGGMLAHGEANTLEIPVSVGTWNTLAGSDGHAHGVLRPSTNWTFPLYELAATGGLRGSYMRGHQYAPLGGLGPAVDSRIPGSGPAGVSHADEILGKLMFGDNPHGPRDPDRDPSRCLGGDAASGDGGPAGRVESRLRRIPSGLGREVLIEALMRPASSGQTAKVALADRIALAYARVVQSLDANEDGIVSFDEAGLGATASPSGVAPLLPVEAFDRFVITRELDDGLLAPRLMPRAVARVLEGTFEESTRAASGGED